MDGSFHRPLSTTRPAPTTLPTDLEQDLVIDITALSYGPFGVGRWQGKTVMVPHTAPGDRIVARLTDSKQRYAFGAVARMVQPSVLRQTPACPYVGRCGGCSWQHLGYETQLSAKQQSVEDALRRIGKLGDFEMRRIIPAADPYGYRRRIRLQADNAKRLGFFGAGSRDLVQIDACAIADDRVNRALGSLSGWLAGLQSAIEHLEIVTGDEPGETVIVAQAAPRFEPGDEPVCADLLNANECISGIIMRGQRRQIWGNPSVTVDLPGDLSLTLDADVFTQVNAVGNRQMIHHLLAMGNFDSHDHTLELYCGAGNFTLPLASRVKAVVAVDGERPAIASGRLNAQKYRLDNIEWQCAPVPQAVARLKRQRRRFAKIVLDPPRAGAKGIVAELAPLGAEAVCYVSCNPTTMARDLAALAQQGYKLRLVQPVDFFPHTFHVESLAVMSR